MSVHLQVTVEVVVVDPQDELEMDLMAEPSNCWSEGAPRWLPAEELFWPLCWSYSEGEEERPHLKGRTSGEEQEEEEEDDPPEYSEGEDQEEDCEEHSGDDQEPGFNGATGGWEEGHCPPEIFEEPTVSTPS